MLLWKTMVWIETSTSFFSPSRFAAKLIAGVLDFKTMIDQWVLSAKLPSCHRPPSVLSNYSTTPSCDCVEPGVCCSETLPVENLGGKPLCMNQYYEVMSSCRIPGPKRDSVVNHARGPTPPKHITVVHNCQVSSTHAPWLLVMLCPADPTQLVV